MCGWHRSIGWSVLGACATHRDWLHRKRNRPRCGWQRAESVRSVASSCRADVPGSLDGHEAFKPGIWAGGRIEHGSELLEFVGIQAEKDLIQHDGLSTVAGRFEHEVRAILAKQAGGVIDQVALLGQSPQIDGGVTHWLLLFAHTQQIHEL